MYRRIGGWLLIGVVMTAALSYVALAEDDDHEDDNHHELQEHEEDTAWDFSDDFDDDYDNRGLAQDDDEHQEVVVYVQAPVNQETAPAEQVTLETEDNRTNDPFNASAYEDDDGDGILNKDDTYPGEDDLLYQDADHDGVNDRTDMYPGVDDTFMEQTAAPVERQEQPLPTSEGWIRKILAWLGIIRGDHA